MLEFENEVNRLLNRISARLSERNWRMVTVESCTGGWIAKCCTDLAGSSEWFDRGYVVYSYGAKEQMLGKSQEDLLECGAVSEEIARQMASGAKTHSNPADTVAVTGIAGTGGGMPGKPVGLVHFAWCIGARPVECDQAVFAGDRQAVRQRTVLHALEGILVRLD